MKNIKIFKNFLNENENDNTEIYTVYSTESDMTFIMESNESESTLEVVGFYFGKEDAASTKQYYRKLKAEM
jgi:hypothetical protein